MRRRVLVAESHEQLHAAAATLIASEAAGAIAARQRFTMALSGGSTIRGTYEHLAAKPGIDWGQVFLFWGDERFVEHDNPYSNYRLAVDTGLTRVPALPAASVFPVPTDAPTPTRGAELYSRTLAEFFGLEPGEFPRFDLAVNGMGPDGHTASLFPHRSAATEYRKIAVMSHAGLAPWVDRVSLTMPVFQNVRTILFVVAGVTKAPVLRQVLEEPPNIKHWPAGSVRPEDGEVVWLVDVGAASLLRSTECESASPGFAGSR